MDCGREVGGGRWGCAKKVGVEGALAAALYARDWHCGRGLLRFGWGVRSVEAPTRVACRALPLGGKPGQRHRQSASLTKGRGGIGAVVAGF